MLGYPKVAGVGELGSGDAKQTWFLLLISLCLPLAFLLSLVLADLAVTESGLALLQFFLSALLESSFLPVGSGYRELWVQLQAQELEGSCPRLLFGSCVQRAPGGFLFSQECDQKWWSHLCSQDSPHFGESTSLPMVLGIEGCGPQ